MQVYMTLVRVECNAECNAEYSAVKLSSAVQLSSAACAAVW